MRCNVLTVLCALAPFACLDAHAGDLEVVFSEAPGHPTSIVPGAVDLAGEPIEVAFKAMEILSVSPDGSQWILKGRNHGASDIDTMLLLGSGTTGSVMAQEGQPIPTGAAGEVFDFFGSSPPHFNEVGDFVYTARARGGSSAIFHKGIRFDGKSFAIVRAMGDPALGLVDLPPDPSGDELFGNSFGSFHILNDGTIGSQDNTIQNISSFRRPAVFYDDVAFMQTGVTPVDEDGIWEELDSNDFWTTPDGKTWIAQGADGAGDILVTNDVVVIREGQAIIETSIVVDDIFHTKLARNGDWFARGDEASGDDWAVRNGALVAATNMQITPDNEDVWGNALVAFTGNAVGDWVLAGLTLGPSSEADSVLVMNGETVLVREGDPVDLDGNGVFDDDAFIGRGNAELNPFHPDDIFLGDDGTVFFLASLRNAAGEDLGEFGTGGDALLRLSPGTCNADATGDGVVDVQDLTAVILAWGTDDEDADVTGDGVVDVQDLTAVIVGWGDC